MNAMDDENRAKPGIKKATCNLNTVYVLVITLLTSWRSSFSYILSFAVDSPLFLCFIVAQPLRVCFAVVPRERIYGRPRIILHSSSRPRHPWQGGFLWFYRLGSSSINSVATSTSPTPGNVHKRMPKLHNLSSKLKAI